jgi:hypothetical protein
MGPIMEYYPERCWYHSLPNDNKKRHYEIPDDIKMIPDELISR